MSRLAFYKKGGKYYAKNTPVIRYWKNNDTTFTRPNITADDDYDYTTVENHYQIFRKE